MSKPHWLPAAALLAVTGLGLPGSAAAARLTTLYSFCSQPACADGKTPVAGLVGDAAGNFYGTTADGGTVGGGPGKGTVFRLAPGGRLSVLHVFPPETQATRDGSAPDAPLVIDAAGRLYGTAHLGGVTAALADAGVAFTLSPSDATEKAVYDFCSQPHCADGYAPNGVILGRGGELYGATTFAESDITGGVIFRLTAADFAVLYAFPYPLHPSAVLTIDAAGTLYGATGNSRPLGPTWGTVFAFEPQHPTPRTLYNFCSQPGCADGFDPNDLIATPAGTLYGTTAMGGDGPYGQGGILFRLTPDATRSRWVFTPLHSFCQQPGCADGAAPAGIVIDAAGNLYGVAGAGATGAGIVFRLAPDGTYTVLHTFCSQAHCADGNAPYGPLLLDAFGNLYGVTGGGGAHGGGSVFELTP